MRFVLMGLSRKVAVDLLLGSLLLTAAASAQAAGPGYSDDPFGDADFRNPPLVLDVAHPTRGRGEVSLLFSSSVIDKYTRHSGGLLVIDYNITNTLGFSLGAGYLHGGLTSIVTDAAGIIGNNVKACNSDSSKCANINPNVPDYRQITGIIDGMFLWAPLYGKINVVSELDVNLQLYLLAGFGANGTRLVQATSASGAGGYALTGGAFGDGGFMNDMKIHFTAGIGVKVFLLDWLALRGEARGILFRDKFDFNQDGSLDSSDGYTSQYWFINAGLTFVLF